MSVSETKSNPLYEIVTGLHLDTEDLLDLRCLHLELISLAESSPRLAPFVSQILLCRKHPKEKFYYYELRTILNNLFAYAIPHPTAIEEIAKKCNRIIEIGAGTGYWASLLEQEGATIRAFDNKSWKLNALYFDVPRGGAKKVADAEEDTLLLCWPPYKTPMSYKCLKEFRGKRLVYVGEDYYGCTGSSKFHDLIDEEWGLEEILPSVRWPGLHDSVKMYSRKVEKVG